MKRLIKNSLNYSLVVYFFCFLVVISINANAQKNRVNTQPKITFETTSHNYGVIFAGDDGEVDFNFKNEGKSPLIISNVVSSCGCTIVKWSKDPVMPNQTGTIKVAYNTNIIGDIKRSITVSTNDQSQNRIVLILTGKVVAKTK
ncbi:MAG: hypothetical protein H6Q16_184 [Bacteroidetes bacterium]|nr:hypothetical protein [Bacteroidota bacterium]